VLGISLSSVGGRADFDIGRLTDGAFVLRRRPRLLTLRRAGHMSSFRTSAVGKSAISTKQPSSIFPQCGSGGLPSSALFENPSRVAYRLVLGTTLNCPPSIGSSWSPDYASFRSHHRTKFSIARSSSRPIPCLPASLGWDRMKWAEPTVAHFLP
jgi:hypothetical protein